MGQTGPTRLIGFARLRRYLILFLVLPTCLWVVFGTPITALAVALSLSFTFVVFESGVWEDVFKDRPEICGDDPFRQLHELNKCDRVVFTGHSLGGAVATIAFAVYRCWCNSDTTRNDNAILFTFGAPRVGDVPFMEEFARLHRRRFCHIVHPGDPVPELPPNGLNELWYRKIWTRGILGFVVMLLFPVWAAIGKLYRANRAARWNADCQTVIAGVPGTLKFANHDMANIYRAWAYSRSDPT